jgi:regulator of CtrA degradation
MSDPNPTDPVVLAKRFASSPAFLTVFREGMGLVEETATYLDGPGRQESKGLERTTALTYATESMRLTTRLMQIASWLLLQRAVNEGELTSEQALREKSKVKLAEPPPADPELLAALPLPLQELIARSNGLYERVRRLDRGVYDEAGFETPAESPVSSQLDLLRSAFGKPAGV